MPEYRVAPLKRDLTFLFMEIKGFVNPAQNTHIRSCMLRFCAGLRLVFRHKTHSQSEFQKLLIYEKEISLDLDEYN